MRKDNHNRYSATMFHGEKGVMPSLKLTLILPLSSVRELISIDGCPFVNTNHGSNEMIVKHRSTRQRTSRSGQSLSQRYTFLHFLNQYWHIVSVRDKDIRYV